MKYGIYSIFDTAVSAYLPPFFMITDQAAARTFRLCCQDESHAFCRSPECYRMFRIGTFDDEKGSMISESPQLILDAQVAKNLGSVKALLPDGSIDFGEVEMPDDPQTFLKRKE